MRNIAAIQARIDSIFREAAEEAALLGASINRDLLEDRIFSFEDYPATKKRIEALMRALNEQIEGEVVNGINASWELSNSKNDALVKAIFGANVKALTEELRRRYFTTNDGAREAFLLRKQNGLNLSDFVWRYTKDFKSEIEFALDCGIRSGESAAQMSRSLRQYLQHPGKLFRRVRDEHGLLRLSQRAKSFNPGRGVYRSSYKNARRLAATETNIAYRTADYLRWQQMDFVVGIEILLSNNHTVRLQAGERTDDPTQQRKDGSPKANAVRPLTDICDELQGRYPKDFKFTGWHPHCRCRAISILKTEEEMARDTERILRGEEPLSASVSKNAVTEVPDNFKQWVKENSSRIEKARKNGTLPYFLKDNEKKKGSNITDSDSRDAEQTISDEFRISSLGRKNQTSTESATTAGSFAEIQTHDELTTALQDKLRENLGYDVEVVSDKALIDLETAKAYATELVKLTREYELKQGKLGKVNLGYNATASNEYGVTFYTPLTQTKTVSLKVGYGRRRSDYAIECSRCDDHLLNISTATHEFGHLLYQFVPWKQLEILPFEKEILKIYEAYKQEFQLAAQKSDNMLTASKIIIGQYGHGNVKEFLAEAFQEYRNCQSPSKYAVKVGRLIDTWFKR